MIWCCEAAEAATPSSEGYWPGISEQAVRFQPASLLHAHGQRRESIFSRSLGASRSNGRSDGITLSRLAWTHVGPQVFGNLRVTPFDKLLICPHTVSAAEDVLPFSPSACCCCGFSELWSCVHVSTQGLYVSEKNTFLHITQRVKDLVG